MAIHAWNANWKYPHRVVKSNSVFFETGKTRKIYWKKIMRNHGLHKRWIDYSSPFTLHIHFGITIRYLICFDIILFNGLNFYERLIASKWFRLPSEFLSFVSWNRIKHLIPLSILLNSILAVTAGIFQCIVYIKQLIRLE